MGVTGDQTTRRRPGDGRSGQINFLYTNIGRGHPFYLDGIIGCLPSERVGDVTDVFAGTTGLARGLWVGARLIYRSVGGGGPYSSLYNRLRQRNDYDRHGPLQRLMGRPLRRTYSDRPDPLVTAHPVLVAILEGTRGLIYQHGEVTAPVESWVHGRHRVLVPLSSTADRFIAAGIPERNLFVSGLCIESALVEAAEGAFEGRLARLAGGDPLCGAFFTSGAEPREHVKRLVSAVLSAACAGGRALVFARGNGRFAARLRARLEKSGRDFASVRSIAELRGAESEVLLCLYENRRGLDAFTARLFERFDYFVAPSHERTNWALGLGLPMFIVDPPLGSYAPLNRELLLAASVARALEERRVASRFGSRVGELHAAGELTRMAEAGWGRFEIRGFCNIAEFLQTL
ncbi:MAG: hypothetical protein PVI01_03170 [Gemmatimonadales bacterium]|jgi:hypothetical protein